MFFAKFFKKSSVVILIAGASLAAHSMSGCSGGEDPRVEALLELVPDIPPETARHLVLSSDSVFVAHIHEIGLRRLNHIFHQLNLAGNVESVQAFMKSSSVLLPCIKRVSDLQAVVHNDEVYRRIYQFHVDAEPDVAILWRKLYNVKDSINKNPDLTELEKIEELKIIMERARAEGFDYFAAYCLLDIAQCYADAGDDEKKELYFRAALREAIASKHNSMQCQILGALGTIYHDKGDVDSMIVCFEEAKRIAGRHNLLGRAERINSFYAAYYTGQGRLSLAHDIYKDILEACTEQKLGYDGIRFWLDAMKFYANLGAWELVGRLLPQVRSIHERDKYVPDASREGMPYRIDRIEARYRMHKGQVEEAEKLYRGIKEHVDELTARLDSVELPYYWAHGLLHNGLPARALPFIEEGYQLAVEMNQPEFALEFVLFRAEAQFALGRLDEAENTLEEFEAGATDLQDEMRQEWIDRDVLRVEIAHKRGDDRGVMDALERAAARFRYYAQKTETGMHGYLWLGRNDKLRHLIHDAIQMEPVLGYGAELYWRDVLRSLEKAPGSIGDEGGVGLGRDGSLGLRSLCDGYGKAAAARVQDNGAIHCVYLAKGDELWRWTCSAGAVRRDVLGMTADRINALAADAWKAMSRDPRDPNAPAPEQLQENLRTLARVLLPQEVKENPGRSPRTFFVTADGALAQLPFGTLNVGPAGEYMPLLLQRDVAYLRHAGELRPDGPRYGGLIFANAGGNNGLRRGILTAGELPHALAECEIVSSALPGSTILYGDTTTKADLLEASEGVPFIYMATHVVRDPDAPYLLLVPLASAEMEDPSASYLDARDIRSAKLDDCRIVVVSGCSSGTPYTAARSQAPGLGDVFLDAGAGMVVGTFWDVQDETARDLMTSFVGRWDNNVSTPGMIRSLCDARREAARGPNGIRHPFRWAAYTIKVGRL